MQEVAQVGSRLGVGRIGPEKESQLSAGLGLAGVQHEPGDERPDALGWEGQYWAFVPRDTEIAEQSNVQSCRHNP